MPKSVGLDMHAMLDVMDAERRSRSCPSVRVYRVGMEPLHWHLLPEERWNRGVTGESLSLSA